MEQEYLQQFTQDRLLHDIEHLEQFEIRPDLCQNLPNLRFIHGQNDGVAPLSEVQTLDQSLPHTTLDIQKDRGHLDLVMTSPICNTQGPLLET